MSLEIRPATSLPLGELAALFTRGYQDYLVPVQVDEEVMRFVVRTFDLDLDAGRAAYRDGEAVGLVNLGVRRERGWIGGLAVVPEARRHGIGRALMEAVHAEARARGVREIWLEVIEGNDGALRLYEQLGYEVVRMLEIGSLDAADGEAADECQWTVAHVRIRELRASPEPWQRDDETLEHYDDLRGLCASDGAAVFRVGSDGRVVLMQLAGEPRGLLQALRSLGPVSIFNVPEEDPTVAAFRELGGEVTLRQREMVLRP